MPSLLVPNSASLAEYNPCHNPAGPGGGRFCNRRAGGFPFGKQDVPLQPPSPKRYIPGRVLRAGEIDAAYGRIYPAKPEAFKAGISKLRGRQRRGAVTNYSVEELGTMKLFLLKGGEAGYAIKNGDELVNVFASGGEKTLGSGPWLVLHAIENGARRLDCFDSGLVELYAKLGFREVRREKNWTPGEPDVVFMEWRGGDPKTARKRFNAYRRLDAD